MASTESQNPAVAALRDNKWLFCLMCWFPASPNTADTKISTPSQLAWAKYFNEWTGEILCPSYAEPRDDVDAAWIKSGGLKC